MPDFYDFISISKRLRFEDEFPFARRLFSVDIEPGAESSSDVGSIVVQEGI